MWNNVSTIKYYIKKKFYSLAAYKILQIKSISEELATKIMENLKKSHPEAFKEIRKEMTIVSIEKKKWKEFNISPK